MAELLTTDEAATYLRLSERKLYELVANGAVPCTKVTGKWLFPKAALDRWLAAGYAGPPEFASASAPPIVGGSHDPLLEWALRESGSRLASLPEGSEAGLQRLARGEVVAAAIHLHRLDGDDDAANVDAVAIAPGLHDAVLIAFARREQGLIVATGNPLNLSDIASVAATRAKLALRPQGAGAQLLLLSLVARAGLALDALATVKPVAPDRARHRPGGARRPRRLRHRHAIGRAGAGTWIRAADVGALRPGDAPARLLPAGAAGAGQVPADRGVPRPRPRADRLRHRRGRGRPARQLGRGGAGCLSPDADYIAALPGDFACLYARCVRFRKSSGEVAEWLKAHAWKACIRETVSWVRIPPSPPALFCPARTHR